MDCTSPSEHTSTPGADIQGSSASNRIQTSTGQSNSHVTVSIEAIVSKSKGKKKKKKPIELAPLSL